MKIRNYVAIAWISFFVVLQSCTDENVLLEAFSGNDSIQIMDSIPDSLEIFEVDSAFDSLFDEDKYEERRVSVADLANLQLNNSLSIHFPASYCSYLQAGDSVHLDSVVLRYKMVAKKSKMVYNKLATTDRSHFSKVPVFVLLRVFDRQIKTYKPQIHSEFLDSNKIFQLNSIQMTTSNEMYS